MFTEEGSGLESVAISALEHWSYCPRQCGLIHLEQTFHDNVDTVRGHLLHKRVDRGLPSTEHGVRILRDVTVWSERLGLHGRVDTVEFPGGVPYPVEHKSGHRRTWSHEAIQLCAQALCLEEMLERHVAAGAITYRGSGTRREITFDTDLRQAVVVATEEVRAMIGSGELPSPIHDARCRRCSLLDTCLPTVVLSPGRVRHSLTTLFDTSSAE